MATQNIHRTFPHNKAILVIKSALRQENFTLFFCILEQVFGEQEQKLFWGNANKSDKVVDIFQYMPPPILELAHFYPEITKTIKQSFVDNKISWTRLKNIRELDLLGLLYIGCHTPECVRFYDMCHPNIYKEFVFKNRKNIFFWEWFLAYIPPDLRLEVFKENYDTDYATTLAYILQSSPNDLRFFNEFCKEIQEADPALFKEIGISKEDAERYKKEHSGDDK